jgi:hypothetical protein
VLKSDSLLRYLAYPANLASIIFILFDSVLLTAATYVGWAGIPLGLIMLTWFLKYGLITVEHITWEQPEEPVLSVEMIHPLEQQKSFILLVVVGEFSAAFYAAQYWFGNIAGVVIGIAAVMLLPAVVAVQVASDSALRALDPRQWVRLLRWLRGDYLLVIAAIIVYWLLAWLMLFTVVAEVLPRLVTCALLMFGWLSVLSLLGGAILERRLADPDDSPIERAEQEVDSQSVERERERKIDRIYGEWRSGAQKNAWQTLMREVQASEAPVDELRWVHERISRWDEPRLAGRVAQELIPRLIAINRYGEAITLTRHRLSADRDFRPVTAAETLHMVRIARDGGDRPTARSLLRDFDRIFPNDPLQTAADDLTRELQR